MVLCNFWALVFKNKLDMSHSHSILTNNILGSCQPSVVASIPPKCGDTNDHVPTFRLYLLRASRVDLTLGSQRHKENVGGDIAKVVGKRVKIMGFPIGWYMGDGSIVRLVAEIDENELKDVPERICRYGTTKIFY